MNKKRLIIATITGAILGVFCIIGANVRFGGSLSNTYLFWFWVDRLAMGVIIGLLPACSHKVRLPIRGILVGLLVSLVFYIATDFTDLTGFLVGGVYGLIIEYASKQKAKQL